MFYGTNSNTGWIGKYDEIPTAAQEGFTEANYDQKILATSIVINKLEKAQAAKKPKAKTKAKAKPARKAVAKKKTIRKKAPAKKKAAKPTATDQVLQIIKRSKKGVDVPTLMKKTKFDEKKVRNIVARAFSQKKIKRTGRGAYTGA